MSQIATAPPPAQLPDFNAETNPFPVVEYLLNQCAYLSLFSIPGQGSGECVEGPGGVLGYSMVESLHRFVISMGMPTARHGIRAHNEVGERIACFRHRWLFAPDDFDAHLGEAPPPTPFDPARSQRFTMLDSLCTFDNGRDSFRGFGTGRTSPVLFDGKPYLLAGAIGAILGGTGKFEGAEGVYTYCGAFTPGRGFTGSLVIRAIDQHRRVVSDRSLPAIRPIPNPDRDFTYIVFRSQKKDGSVKTTYRIGPDGMPNGLHLEPQLRILDLDAGFGVRSQLHALNQTGAVIGKMNADINFNPFGPSAPGTALAPIPFSNLDEYIFTTPDGQPAGSFFADGSEGRVFNMTLPVPRQRALRFGGFGPLQDGKGPFAGIQGMMAHNSGVGVAPHALSTLFLCRIFDPAGKYRGE